MSSKLTMQYDNKVSIILTFICSTNTILSPGCPTGATITPHTGPFAPGDVLTCNADGYDPTYTWTGVVNGVLMDTHTGSTHTLMAGDFQVICTATVSQLTCPSTYADVEGTAEGFPVGKY